MGDQLNTSYDSLIWNSITGTNHIDGFPHHSSIYTLASKLSDGETKCNQVTYLRL